jgi:hypothetical protein
MAYTLGNSNVDDGTYFGTIIFVKFKCCEKLDSKDPYMGDGPLDDIQLSERIFFDYLKKTYATFLETGERIDTETDDDLIKSFGTFKV